MFDLKSSREVWSENTYYDFAEKYMKDQWNNMIFPRIKDCDFSNTVDLAAGHGRNSQYLIPLSGKTTIIDICKENIAFCKKRFKKNKNIKYIVNSGSDIPVDDHGVSLLYCFDAAVHFPADVVFEYLKEAKRVLVSGGTFFIHHSNYIGFCNKDWRHNPHARNYMNHDLFIEKCNEVGLEIISSDIIDWGGDKDFIKGLDCISVLRA